MNHPVRARTLNHTSARYAAPTTPSLRATPPPERAPFGRCNYGAPQARPPARKICRKNEKRDKNYKYVSRVREAWEHLGELRLDRINAPYTFGADIIEYLRKLVVARMGDSGPDWQDGYIISAARVRKFDPHRLEADRVKRSLYAVGLAEIEIYDHTVIARRGALRADKIAERVGYEAAALGTVGIRDRYEFDRLQDVRVRR
jgi:hypothetical protein